MPYRSSKNPATIETVIQTGTVTNHCQGARVYCHLNGRTKTLMIWYSPDWQVRRVVVLADWPRLRRRFTEESAQEINDAALLSVLSEALVEFVTRRRS